MTSVLNLEPLLRIIIDSTIKLTHADRGFLMLRQADGRFGFRIARNNDQETLSRDDFHISFSIVNQVIETSKAVWIGDISASDSVLLSESMVQLQLRSVMCAPLEANNDFIGVIYVDSSINSNSLNQYEFDLLETLAAQAAVAIENARLYSHMEELVEKRTTEINRQKDELALHVTYQQEKLVALAKTIAEKNKTIRDLRQQLPVGSRQELSTEEKAAIELKEALSGQQDLDDFNAQFTHTYPDFLAKLVAKCPDLSRKELLVCALIKIGMTTMQIANILYRSKRSIGNHRYTIRKKIGLDPNQKLKVLFNTI